MMSEVARLKAYTAWQLKHKEMQLALKRRVIPRDPLDAMPLPQPIQLNICGATYVVPIQLCGDSSVVSLEKKKKSGSVGTGSRTNPKPPDTDIKLPVNVLSEIKITDPSDAEISFSKHTMYCLPSIGNEGISFLSTDGTGTEVRAGPPPSTGKERFHFCGADRPG